MRFHQWLSLYRSRNGALPVLLALAALAMASGCASPDEPTPRHPIVPQTVRDLQARQQGDDVVLTFTLPSQSTSNAPLAAPPAIEIYSGQVEAGGKPAEKTAMKLIYTIPSEMTNSYVADGRIVYRVHGVTPGSAAIYVVRTRAARNRASAESQRAVVNVRAAPAVVENVSARIAGQSVTLSWPHAGDARYRVYRAEITPESAPAAATDASKAVLRMPMVQVAQTGAPTNEGSGTSLQYQDENVEFGHSYLYIVRSVAEFGSDVVESADSKAAVITVAESMPPAAPQELQAVAAPAAGAEPAYVSLSWEISADAGVNGYAVYRSEQAGARGVRLNEELAGAPTYRDASVMAGRRYFYSVTAVDAAGVESEPSATVAALIPPAQP